MAAPTVQDLRDLLGRDVSDSQGGAALKVVTAQAKAYVRGGSGWTPNDEIASVIITASARLVSNPSTLLYDNTVGPESVSYRSAFTGWSLTEKLTLDRYRVKAR